jgi:hypothetical protein
VEWGVGWGGVDITVPCWGVHSGLCFSEQVQTAEDDQVLAASRPGHVLPLLVCVLLVWTGVERGAVQRRVLRAL